MGVNGPLRWTLPAIAVVALLAPAADAKPGICTKKGIVDALTTAGKLTIDRVSNQRFDVQQPYYASDDANCCPSAFDVFPYRFNGTTFKRGTSKRYKHFQKHFH